ncbi:hypothetical protein ILYODFUR_010211 [Ilyodon furcidens]|uniref:Uncharacterized protein n=1 Tax=Ilyodon furcidens TaxID=33524 RepID=A0ABV0THQ0_9TELE
MSHENRFSLLYQLTDLFEVTDSNAAIITDDGRGDCILHNGLNEDMEHLEDPPFIIHDVFGGYETSKLISCRVQWH